MTTEQFRRQSRSFGAVAQRYDRYRPGYAPEAVRWALGEQPLRVIDLGAGTGILSRLLHRLGHQVSAVEPDDQMRAQLTQVSPEIAAIAGTAGEIPLPDGSVDAVIAGQSYHWFDPGRAHPEIARVLRPGGVFAALWNDADFTVRWTVQLVEIIDGPEAATQDRRAADFGPLFGPVERAEHRHEVPMTPDDLVGMATTRSPYLVADESGRRELIEAVRQLITGPELAGRASFPMPYVTRVHRAIRRADTSRSRS